MALYRITVVNLTSNNLPFTTNRPTSLYNIETQLTASRLMFLDNTRAILIYNRRTQYARTSYVIP